MLIHRIAAQLATAPEFREVERTIKNESDATFGVPQSARPLVIASLFARNPAPYVVIVAGEDAADRMGRALASYVGADMVERFVERTDLPWSDKNPDGHVIGMRSKALAKLAAGEPFIMVASMRALLRMVPPVGSEYYKPLTLAIADVMPFEDVPKRLLFLGYSNAGAVTEPGTFYVHGDAVDVWPAQAASPVRLEFFGDEIDSIRRMVASTGQTIGEQTDVEIYPCRELALTPEAIERFRRSMYTKAQDDQETARHYSLLSEGIIFPEIDRYISALYTKTVLPLAHIHKKALFVLAEPRSLVDDATRLYDEVHAKAQEKRVDLTGLYCLPAKIDFGEQQRLTLVSLMRAGAGTVTADLRVQQPDVADGQKLYRRLDSLRHMGYSLVFSIPNSDARRSMLYALTDEHIPFVETISSSPENRAPCTPAGALQPVEPLPQSVVCIADAPIAAGVVLPDARLAVISVDDLRSRMAKHGKRKNIDVTDITFPFKPGDYVVHAVHGVVYFSQILRKEVGGRERDYFLLEYAAGDKLYIPFEQADRITRYVGPNGENPRLTRLHTADWSRATAKARSAAKKLAFDLVDLYTRRASAQGFAFGPDTPWQLQMEESFPYELTSDQEAAITDIKADMEAAKPMDRLLCGDVGFGKTEVALRAAFKATQDNKQVMVLCPTTILAQQHYETFRERFDDFGVRVDVLSRFRTTAQQKKSLEGFSKGDVQVLIGTHRLLSHDVNPRDLGLVIVDEEQRFGVQHKEQLKNMREQVDVLTLSATPIPRTMQMALSGVRDMSLIKTPPSGRRAVKVHVGEWDEDIVSAAIRLELGRGGQVYYVSNRVRTIDEAVMRVLSVAPEARVGVAHGKMSEKALEDVMERFSAHEYDVLVATTIIESGIDNPHTNTLIIEDSQRLGLAQLYQLKGRVGRGSHQAYAYFMFPPEMQLSEEATDRLQAIGEFTDLGSGTQIALRDLEIRGAGSLMGAEQSGNLSSVGFDLYTQMLGAAIAEARGEAPDEAADVTVSINLPADYYLDETYIPDVDRRVLVYRKLAAAADLAAIDALEEDTKKLYGDLPTPAQNLFDRARIRIRGDRLGIESIGFATSKIQVTGVDVPRIVSDAWRSKGAQIFAVSHKVNYPAKRKEEGLLKVVLGMLEDLGGADE
ncbi:MAG: transcription-repair coupling factor [Coriobacteriales bacterium]|nr:transcription-repair coupling factor [Coriobacteriales bacterium]